MDPKTFVKELKESGNTLLTGLARLIEALRDTEVKKGRKFALEMLFAGSVSLVEFGGERHIVTSQKQYLSFIERLRLARNRSKAVRMVTTEGKFARFFRSSDRGIVRTWDLIANRKLEIPLAAKPKATPIAVFSAENVQALATATLNILERGKRPTP